jgi:hypothetical protein
VLAIDRQKPEVNPVYRGRFKTERDTMKKSAINALVVLAVLLGMCASVSATPVIPSAPDTATTSLLLTVSVAGLGILRKFMR